LTFCPYVLILFSMGQGSEIEPEGQIYTLNLLERLHDGLRDFDKTKDNLYWRIDALLRELRNPNLHQVEPTTAFQIELWDRHGKSHLRMVLAATSSIMIAHAAFDAAVKQYATERLTLRKGAMVLRDHTP
jgi:hypothetical protein